MDVFEIYDISEKLVTISHLIQKISISLEEETFFDISPKNSHEVAKINFKFLDEILDKILENISELIIPSLQQNFQKQNRFQEQIAVLKTKLNKSLKKHDKLFEEHNEVLLILEKELRKQQILNKQENHDITPTTPETLKLENILKIELQYWKQSFEELQIQSTANSVQQIGNENSELKTEIEELTKNLQQNHKINAELENEVHQMTIKEQQNQKKIFTLEKEISQLIEKMETQQLEIGNLQNELKLISKKPEVFDKETQNNDLELAIKFLSQELLQKSKTKLLHLEHVVEHTINVEKTEHIKKTSFDITNETEDKSCQTEQQSLDRKLTFHAKRSQTFRNVFRSFKQKDDSEIVIKLTSEIDELSKLLETQKEASKYFETWHQQELAKKNDKKYFEMLRNADIYNLKPYQQNSDNLISVLIPGQNINLKLSDGTKSYLKFPTRFLIIDQIVGCSYILNKT